MNRCICGCPLAEGHDTCSTRCEHQVETDCIDYRPLEDPRDGSVWCHGCGERLEVPA